jgi:hypothetical protein
MALHASATLPSRWSFTPRQLYSRGKNPRCALHRGLDRPQLVWVTQRREGIITYPECVSCMPRVSHGNSFFLKCRNSQVKTIRMSCIYTLHGTYKKAYRIFVRKLFGKPKNRWYNIMKMLPCIRKLSFVDVNWQVRAEQKILNSSCCTFLFSVYQRGRNIKIYIL